MFYNCHIHTFTAADVPSRYLPFTLVKALQTRLGFWILSGFMKNLIPFTNADLFDRYAQFISIGKLGSQERIFHECSKYYPPDTRFLVHAIDMEFMGAGKTKRAYRDQVMELGMLARKNARVIPFLQADPRRKDLLNLVQELVTEQHFSGIKLYPSMGYYPFDERLNPVFNYCEQHHLPVMAHCGPYNPTFFKGSRMELISLLKAGDPEIITRGKNKQELCAHFSHPIHYKKVLANFPKLHICLAHFGSGHYWDRYIHDPEDPDNWFVHIKELIENYSGIYTDISFTMNQMKYFSLLKVLMADPKLNRKILFGSDFYMVHTKADERRFGLDLRAFLGEDSFSKIARENVEDYLKVGAESL